MKRYNTNSCFIGALVLFISTILYTSCNKDFNDVLLKSELTDTLGLPDGKRKVLFIVLDGVRGRVLETVRHDNISEITRNSIYSYDGVADYQRNELTQASAWTTMLSGVDYSKHNVILEDFSDYDPVSTPSVFSNLKKEIVNVRTVSLASSFAFNANLAVDATIVKDFTSDQEVIDAAVNEIGTEDPSLLLVQLHSAELAASGNYSETNTNYTNALEQIDNYVGDLLEALKARKFYNKENWLIVIASSKGGGLSGGVEGSNIYMDESRNTFVAFYNPKFRKQELSRPSADALPYTGWAPRFISTNNTQGLAIQSNPAVGNFGAPTSGSFTLMYKFRDNHPDSRSWPMMFGKRDPSSNVGGGGWSYIMSGGGALQLDWGGSPRPGVPVGSKDAKWHTLGFTLTVEGNTRRLRVYHDGILLPTTYTIGHNVDSNFPIRIGTDLTWNTDFLIRDVVILDVALSEEEMPDLMRREFGEDNPYFTNAIGWWPAKENSGSRLYDYSGNGNDFLLTEDIQFTEFSDLSPNLSPNFSEPAYRVVPNNVDIATMIYNWLNVTVPADWNLMGKFYNPTINFSRD